MVLNKNIFTVYQNDPDLTASQNLRLRNITIALGLWGSLYNAFDEPDPVQLRARGWLSTISKIKNVFTAVAVIAAAVAVVVAPIVAFFNPAAGLVIHEAMQLVIVASHAVVLGLTALEKKLDDSSSEPPAVVYVPAINVKNWYENKTILNGAEFHIGRGQDVLLEFSSPGMDTTNTTLASVFKDPAGYGYEPGNSSFPNPVNAGFFYLES